MNSKNYLLFGNTYGLSVESYLSPRDVAQDVADETGNMLSVKEITHDEFRALSAEKRTRSFKRLCSMVKY